MARDYVKLGEKASSFYDPSSGLQLANKQVIKLNNKHKQSKRVTNALKRGHLDWADKEEFETWLKTQVVKGAAPAAEKEKDEDFDPTQSTAEELKNRYTVKEMKELILKNNEDIDEGDLPKKKDELAEIILAGYQLEEDEDEDEEEEEDEDDED